VDVEVMRVRILVVGSSGFIGRHLLASLLEHGEEAIGFDVRPPEEVGSDVDSHRPPFVAGNMANYDDIMSALVEHGIHRVIALGYVMAPLFSPDFSNFIDAVKVNLLGITNVFEASVRSGVDRVVLGSSVGVYGTAEEYGDEAVTEDSRQTAPGLYGRMKMVNETIADKYREIYGLQTVKVRPSAILGVGNTMWPSLLISPVAVGEPGSAPFGSSSRNNVVAVEDLAELYRKILVAQRLEHDTYLASGHNVVMSDLAKAIYRFVPRAQLNFDESTPPPPYPTTFDNTRAVREFDWKLHSLEESVLLHLNAERSRQGYAPIEP
jgi:nucleoside-diphosphate-sugar epimerase